VQYHTHWIPTPAIPLILLGRGDHFDMDPSRDPHLFRYCNVYLSHSCSQPVLIQSRTHSPGALREPAHTDILPAHGLIKLGTVFGLLISGVRLSPYLAMLTMMLSSEVMAWYRI